MAIAAGALFGLNAALIKATVERLDEGVVHVLADWHAWAMVAVGYAATSFGQSSLQAGALGPSLATQAAVGPLAGILVGILVLGERVHDSAALSVAAIGCVALTLAGTVALALGSQAGLDVRLTPGRAAMAACGDC